MRNKISIHSRFSMEKLIESGFPENTAATSSVSAITDKAEVQAAPQ